MIQLINQINHLFYQIQNKISHLKNKIELKQR